MKEGRIVEHGEHDALYHQDGVYKEIFNAMAKSLNIEKLPRLLVKRLRKKLTVKACIGLKKVIKNPLYHGDFYRPLLRLL